VSVVYPESVAKQTQSARGTRQVQQRDTPEPPATFNRIERVLAFMVVGVIGVSLLCFAIMIVGWLTIKTIPGTGIWPLVLGVTEVGLPIGLVLMIALFVVTAVRRVRENRDGSR
jgi:TRAP-type C4-dicarboxylate transport system permease small subunit